MVSATLPPQKPKICFVSPYNYSLFNSRYSNIFGGWEVQIYHIAKEIARRGEFRVSVIVADMGQPERELRQGVELIAWKGKPFWGISPSEPPPDDAAPAEKQAQPAPPPAPPPEAPPAAWRDHISRTYKRRVPWRARTILHGIAAGMIAGKHAAYGEMHAAFQVARRAVGSIGDTAVLPEDVQVFAKADADVYIAPGVSDVSALTAWYCRAHARPYVMLAGSDRDFNPDILKNPDGKDVYSTPYSLLLYTIRNASCHIVQNETQVQLARAFDISPVLIPNPIDLTLAYPRVEEPQTILWVGNTEETVKQPQVMLRLIGDLPEYSFLMIVTPVDQAAYVRLQAQAAHNPNVQLLARIPFDEVERYYAQARLLVSTSAFEGFPNAFLQAGKYGAPVVSLNVDPNGMLSRHGGGLLCDGDTARLAENVTRLMTDDALYARLSANIRQYVRAAHDPEKIIPQYEAVFRSAVFTDRRP